MQAIWVDKNIPRMLMTKALAPLWPGFIWTPLSAAGAGQIPDPALPGPRWMRVRTELCGICATDLSLLAVHADPSVAPAALPGIARIFLGHEVSAIVTEVGAGVTRFRSGDRVTMDTHFTGANCVTLGIEPPCRHCTNGEYVLCDNSSAPGPRAIGAGFGDGFITHESAVYPVPGELSTAQVAMIEPFSVAVHAVARCVPQPGDRVLVIGAGIIGLMTVMAIRAIQPQAQITVIARYPHQQAMAERLGAKNVLDNPAYAEIARLTGGRYFSAPLNKGVVVGGFDIIYDCVADARTTNDALRWARAGGTVVAVGVHMTPMPKVDLTRIWFHEVNLIGTNQHGMDTFAGMRKHTYEWVLDFYRRGAAAATDSLVTHHFPMRDHREAFRLAGQKRREKVIKVVLENE